VLDDWREADVSPKLRAMLGFLEKMTLDPDGLDAADAEALHAAGISQQAMEDAIWVTAVFNVYDRLADAMNFAMRTHERFRKDAAGLWKRGYRLP
jgi:alkylhydroperoxidase family enzyme